MKRVKQRKRWDEVSAPHLNRKKKKAQFRHERRGAIAETKFRSYGRDLPVWCPSCSREQHWGSRVRQVVVATPSDYQLEYLQLNAESEIVLAETIQACHTQGCAHKYEVRKVAYGPRQITLEIRSIDELEDIMQKPKCERCELALPLGSRGPYKQKDGKTFYLKPEGKRGREHTCG